MNTTEHPSWIETYTGKRFHLLDPKEDEIDIIDIAHSLGMQCRYTGHCSTFYSVGEHSLIVSYLVPSELALQGLLHDASEGYLADVAGPLKPHIAGYKELEEKVMQLIFKKFNLEYPYPDIVKEMDTLQLQTEVKYLMSSEGKDWGFPKREGKMGKVPRCLPPDVAKVFFLDRFFELTDGPRMHEASPQLILPGMIH